MKFPDVSSSRFVMKYGLRKSIVFFTVLLFLISWLIGITGSGILNFSEDGLYHPSFIHSNPVKLLGTGKAIRGDEWAVGTELAIAQYNNDEFFPKLNKKLGLDGKNLAICHDTGVPVFEFSLLGKPATWGFFLFDLRHALSWYWLTPILISLLGVFLLLEMFFIGQTGINFLLSVLLTYSFHSVAWSFWPAYQIGLGACATVCFLQLFKEHASRAKFLLAFGLGIFASSLILTLYLPRIIPVATFLLFISICYIKLNFNKIAFKSNLAYILLGLLLALIIGVAYYVDNKDAINSMLSSTYPGQRRVLSGEKSLWNEFIGWLGPIFIRRTYGWANPCEATTYCSIIIPFLIVMFTSLRKHLDLIILGILVFLVFNYIYLYIGIPAIIGKLSLWDRTTGRAIIGIDFANIFLLGWLYSKREDIHNNKIVRNVVGIVYPIIVLVLLYALAPEQIRNRILSNHLFYYCAIFVFLTHYLFVRDLKKFLKAYTVLMLVFTYFWNPVGIAPSYLKSSLPNELFTSELNKFNGRIVSAHHGYVTNEMAAAGLCVYNPTSHYVDKSIYNKFYKEIDRGEYNKFNHMFISVSDDKTYLESSGDLIKFHIHGPEFDFKNFGADYLLTMETDFDSLKDNFSVELIIKDKDYLLYRILH